MFRRLLIVLTLVACAEHARVRPPGTLPFRTYGREAGLGNLSVMRVVQDAAGFLWVATQDGVYRYDGSRFDYFGLEEGVPSSFVSSLAAGRDGGVWVGTHRGVARWNGTRFEAIAGLPTSTPNAIAVDARGLLWTAFAQGLYAGATKVWYGPAEATAVWCNPRDGAVWTARPARIGRYKERNWTWWTAPNERIDGVVVDARNTVWIRSANHLYSKAEGQTAFRDETANLPATSNNGYLCLDARGDVWVPTDRGIAVHDANGWRTIGAREGLPTEWARDVIEDREGSIWVASLGLHRMLGRGEFTSFKRANGLPNEVTWAFRWDGQERLLVGTDLGLARTTAGASSPAPRRRRSAASSSTTA